MIKSELTTIQQETLSVDISVLRDGNSGVYMDDGYEWVRASRNVSGNVCSKSNKVLHEAISECERSHSVLFAFDAVCKFFPSFSE